MGYTHHWNHKKMLSMKDWRKFQKFALSIFIHAAIRGVPVAADSEDPEYNHGRPEMTPDHLFFNGIGENGLETFVIDRKPTPWAYGPDDPMPNLTELEKKEGIYCFCKTARKPYDLICVAMLCYLTHYHSAAFRIWSDGDPEDWVDGLALAKIIDPEIWNMPEQVAA